MLRSNSGGSPQVALSRRFGRAGAMLVAASLVASLFTGIPARPVLADSGRHRRCSSTARTTTSRSAGAGTRHWGPRFTLECGSSAPAAGTSTTTGNGGVTSAIPLLTKGRGEAEAPANVELNWFLGIMRQRQAGGRLRGVGGRPRPNHPVDGEHRRSPATSGTTPRPHTTARWNLYLDGVLDDDVDLGVGLHPASDSIQHAGLATAMTSAAQGRVLSPASSTRPGSGMSCDRRGRSRAPSTRRSPVHRPDRPMGPERGHGHDRGRYFGAAAIPARSRRSDMAAVPEYVTFGPAPPTGSLHLHPRAVVQATGRAAPPTTGTRRRRRRSPPDEGPRRSGRRQHRQELVPRDPHHRQLVADFEDAAGGGDLGLNHPHRGHHGRRRQRVAPHRRDIRGRSGHVRRRVQDAVMASWAGRRPLRSTASSMPASPPP